MADPTFNPYAPRSQWYPQPVSGQEYLKQEGRMPKGAENIPVGYQRVPDRDWDMVQAYLDAVKQYDMMRGRQYLGQPEPAWSPYFRGAPPQGPSPQGAGMAPGAMAASTMAAPSGAPAGALQGAPRGTMSPTQASAAPFRGGNGGGGGAFGQLLAALMQVFGGGGGGGGPAPSRQSYTLEPELLRPDRAPAGPASGTGTPPVYGTGGPVGGMSTGPAPGAGAVSGKTKTLGVVGPMNLGGNEPGSYTDAVDRANRGWPPFDPSNPTMIFGGKIYPLPERYRDRFQERGEAPTSEPKGKD